MSLARLSMTLTAMFASACVGHQTTPLRAEAQLEGRSGATISGRAILVEKKGLLTAHIEAKGFAPGSEHGFHVHDKGDCSAADASSAGGHFNPGSTNHGRAGDGAHHAGDVLSLTADAKGAVRADVAMPGVTLAAGPTSIAGRSLVVHRDRDDFVTQPSGNSGPRVACGVITVR